MDFSYSMQENYKKQFEPDAEHAVQFRFNLTCQKHICELTDIGTLNLPRSQAANTPWTRMRILLVEDDARLAAETARFLRECGMAVDIAGNGIDALHLAGTESYDVIALDIGLPGLDGMSVLSALRDKDIRTPVLILTARDRFADKAAGFRAGADDYLTKPFLLEELVLRLHALVRRAAGHAHPALRIGGLTLDTITGLTTLDEMPVRLTALERRVLTYLMLHPGRTISRTELSEHVYEHDQDRDFNSLEVMVSRLRKKLGRGWIETSRGEGYRMTEVGG